METEEVGSKLLSVRGDLLKNPEQTSKDVQ